MVTTASVRSSRPRAAVITNRWEEWKVNTGAPPLSHTVTAAFAPLL